VRVEADFSLASSVPMTKISGFGCPSSKISIDWKMLLEIDQKNGSFLNLAAVP